MEEVRDFPFEVIETPHMAIPMPDGVSLSARVWRPKTDKPVPAVLEYLPYRKRDGTAERDALTHPYLAGHGYACIRVDMRGCGDSEGLFEDEYSPQELSDGVSVIEWLAAQDWCCGNVGMMGISWGGFNGLQIAALAPSALKAVVSLCSTADRYADDIHYKGGVMLGENPAWAATVLGWFALPPDPEIVGDDWKGLWLERLKNTPFLAETWVREQSRSAYWKHGSVCEDYSAIKAAVLSVGGWHDGYRNTVAHLVENLEAPAKGLLGPWNHKYPHFAVPGPRIDFLGEMLAWWDRWLKDEPNGVDDWPDMRRWLMDSVPPQVSYEHRPGRWIVDNRQNVSAPMETWFCVGNALTKEDGVANRKAFTELSCGQAAGEYFPFGFGPGELPGDQRPDDVLSCCFDSSALPETRDIVGAPTVALKVRATTPRAQVAVRLCDVHPNGESTLISHGFFNLRCRDGFENFKDITPNEVMDVTIALDHCAYRVPAGHRLRIALSPSYWPFVWPEPQDTTLLIEAGQLELPVRPTATASEWRFDGPKAAPARRKKVLRSGDETKRVTRDIGTGALVTEIEGDTGSELDLSTGLETAIRHQERFEIVVGDPTSAQSEFRWQRDLARGDWRVHVNAELVMKTDGENFLIDGHLTVREGADVLLDKSWKAVVPRL